MSTHSPTSADLRARRSRRTDRKRCVCAAPRDGQRGLCGSWPPAGRTPVAQLARVWAETELWNGAANAACQWGRGNAGIHAVIVDGDVYRGVTAGRDRHQIP